ncbi:hypothetical protein BS78_05G083800 [Paspalum vaginatum]|nr:hypothetical protein BS78_05G083800 [Paspalum vaginatum]
MTPGRRGTATTAACLVALVEDVGGRHHGFSSTVGSSGSRRRCSSRRVGEGGSPPIYLTVARAFRLEGQCRSGGRDWVREPREYGRQRARGIGCGAGSPSVAPGRGWGRRQSAESSKRISKY